MGSTFKTLISFHFWKYFIIHFQNLQDFFFFENKQKVATSIWDNCYVTFHIQLGRKIWIYRQLGLEESDIRKTAEDINTLLVANQSLMDELSEEENEDGEE